MNAFRFRIIDTAGSELGIVESHVESIGEDETVRTPDGRMARVIEVYDDEHGREGGVQATLVVDDE